MNNNTDFMQNIPDFEGEVEFAMMHLNDIIPRNTPNYEKVLREEAEKHVLAMAAYEYTPEIDAANIEMECAKNSYEQYEDPRDVKQIDEHIMTFEIFAEKVRKIHNDGYYDRKQITVDIFERIEELLMYREEELTVDAQVLRSELSDFGVMGYRIDILLDVMRTDLRDYDDLIKLRDLIKERIYQASQEIEQFMFLS